MSAPVASVDSKQPSPPLPASSNGISRAFQLRNDADVLVIENTPFPVPHALSLFADATPPSLSHMQVRLVLRDDQGGGDGFCHVDTLLAPRIVFPAIRRG